MTIPSFPWYSRFNGHFHDIGTGPGEYSPSFISVHQNPYAGVGPTEAGEIAAYVTEAVNNYSELKAEVVALRDQVARLEAQRKREERQCSGWTT
jgi:hypothetical protein